jgi:hypothetical protein
MVNVEKSDDLTAAESLANLPHGPAIAVVELVLRDAILTHPTMSEGLSQLVANIPIR